jgi:hypothetical protein
MSPHDTALERNEYRVVLVKSGSRAVWIESGSNVPRLPRLAVPRWARPAEKLQNAIADAWNTRAIILEFLPIRADADPCAVVEILSSERPDSLAATDIEELPRAELNVEERDVIRDVLAEKPNSRGPFARVGWIEEAREWLGREVGGTNAITGEIRQLNASGRFALLRFKTEAGPDYWLKATGYPNAHEFQITKMLAELCPEFLPSRIAGREDWNAWLMEDAGRPLDVWTLTDLEGAVLSMGTLQSKTVSGSMEFNAAGARDQRIGTLRTHLVELVEYIEKSMERQTSNRVPRIDERRLWALASILDLAFTRMEELGIPDALVHNDINSGNILFKGKRCAFTDWCEAGVGNPFIAFQYLCFLQPRGENNWTRRLRDLYRELWLDRLGAHEIEQAFVLMPLLACFSWLYGRGKWLNSPQRNDPEVEASARSLARHMDRAAQAPELLEILSQ